MGIRAISVVALGLIACGAKSPAPVGPPPGPPPVAPPVAEDASPPPTADTPAPVAAAPSGAIVGTAHPIVIEAVARDGAWVVICQARKDTNGDGEIEVNVGYHGDTWGDSFEPYVVRGAGEGEPIDSLVGYTRDGRWLVALRAGELAVLDVTTGLWQELPGADVRDDGVPLGPSRVASVARGGDVMTYFRDDETIVIRELSSGAEKVVKVPGARVWRVELEPSGLWARAYVMKTDTDKDGKLTRAEIDQAHAARRAEAGQRRQARMDARFATADANKDGRLSRDEVKDSRLASRFDALDANKDGSLSRDELAAGKPAHR